MFKDRFKYIGFLIIIIVSFILYGNTLNHKYALDDRIVITDNIYTKKGFDGISDIFKYDSFKGFFQRSTKLVPGGRYRPLSIATFAVEWEFFSKKTKDENGKIVESGNPFISHLLNILFYALTGIILYLVLLNLFKNQTGLLSIPFIATILFLCHPVHTEAIANIKGRDEILAFLFSILSLLFFIKYCNSKLNYHAILNLILSVLFLFLGLLSKENTITFFAVIPITIYFFTNHSLKKVLLGMGLLLIPIFVFIYLRYNAIGYWIGEESNELFNNPFLNADTSEKFGTIFYTLWKYIELSFVPHTLTHDYYPFQVELIEFTHIASILPFILYVGLFAYAIKELRNKNIISYCILLFLIPLSIVSNIVVGVGTFMNERFIYFSTLGVALFIAYILIEKLKPVLKSESSYKVISLALLFVVITGFSWKTISRNPVWENDLVLFTTDVKTSKNSAKVNISAGGKIWEEYRLDKDENLKKEKLNQSKKYLHKAIKIYKEAYHANTLLGKVYYDLGDYKNAIKYLTISLTGKKTDDEVWMFMFSSINKIDSKSNLDYKLKVYNSLLSYKYKNYEIYCEIANLNGQFLGKLDVSEKYLLKAIEIDANKPTAYNYLGIVYGMTRNFDKALETLFKAKELDPKNVTIVQNIAATYHAMNKPLEAEKYMEIANSMGK